MNTTIPQNKVLPLSRQRYEYLLGQSMPVGEFRGQVAALLDADPYFMPGHLEMLWCAEAAGDRYLYRKQAMAILGRAKEMLRSRRVRKRLSASWTEIELRTLDVLISILLREGRLGLFDRLSLKLLKQLGNTLIDPKTSLSPRESKHLKLQKQIDISRFAPELGSVGPHWWLVGAPSGTGSSYYTQLPFIPLYAVAEHKDHDDGAPETSQCAPTFLSERFPLVSEEVCRLTDEFEIRLQQATLVLMKPYTQSYRHCDVLPNNSQAIPRYHLILRGGGCDILSSGPETVAAKEGELWLLDNSVMYRTQNISADPSVHVIIEGHPRERD